jgi:hypothetical protein
MAKWRNCQQPTANSEKRIVATKKPTIMKRIAILITLTFSFIAGIYAQNMKLEDILENYFKANGFEKMQKVQTIIMKGMLVQQDAMPVKIVKMRPDKYLMEFDVADLTAYQGYDGKTAWMTTPWTGNPKPQLMPEDRARNMKNTSDFDGLLFNWKAKGHTAELAGTDSVSNLPTYKIKLTKKDGGIEYYLIDTKGYMLQKRISYRTIRGKESEFENYFRDYRAVGGIIFPFIIDTSIDDQPYSSSQFETIELNKTVDEKIFEMPGN